VYVPFAQIPMMLGHVVVRTERDPLVLASALRDAVATVDPLQRVGPLTTLDDLVSSTQRPWRFNMALAVLLGAVGTVLASVALFGTVAHGVTERTREIGVRRALGATSANVMGVVSRDAMGAAIVGAGIGAAGAPTAAPAAVRGDPE
jgi:ABC-type iron transport system FetAB permease component